MAAYPAKAHIVKDDTLDISKAVTSLADTAALGAFIDAMAPNDFDIIEVKVTSATAQPADKDRPDSVQAPNVSAVITFSSV